MAGDHLEIKGEVVEVNKNKFIVKPDFSNDENDSSIIAQLSGKMRQKNIRVLLGDKVSVKVSPYCTTNGIIVRRH